jgi:hypothetical protein
MVLLKILKRRDASSIVVAILVAMIVFNLLLSVTAPWANQVLGLSNNSPGLGWENQYLAPALAAFFQLLVLEVLGWLWVWSVGFAKKR